ncbi:MAG: hypothetical protein U1F35_16335 [Steroidobacteraceae bacterium]
MSKDRALLKVQARPEPRAAFPASTWMLLVMLAHGAQADPPATAMSPGETPAGIPRAGEPEASTTPAREAAAAGTAQAFASDDVLSHHRRAALMQHDEGWMRTMASPRAYPATFSPVPSLRSLDYLDQLSLPTLGGDGHGIRDQSPTEQWIRQVRREGMPFARLWQSDAALLSLGLNRKGKPGLWIIQKTR